MSEKIAEGVYVQCPFYKSHSSHTISCEGVVLFSNCCTQGFNSVSERKAFMRANCNKVDGGECILYKTLYSKY